MKDKDKTKAMSMVPQRIRSYLTLNLVLAVLMAVVLAVRAELRTGRFLLIDIFLFTFYSVVLASILAGPIGIIEIYLYRRKKGAWFEWRNQTRRRRHDGRISPEERKYWKSEAYRARLSLGTQARADRRNRTRLFEHENAADAVSRPALLMTVADKFEQAGKRQAAQRCYLQVTQRFPDSEEAKEAARRLASPTNA